MFPHVSQFSLVTPHDFGDPDQFRLSENSKGVDFLVLFLPNEIFPLSVSTSISFPDVFSRDRKVLFVYVEENRVVPLSVSPFVKLVKEKSRRATTEWNRFGFVFRYPFPRTTVPVFSVRGHRLFLPLPTPLLHLFFTRKLGYLTTSSEPVRYSDNQFRVETRNIGS